MSQKIFVSLRSNGGEKKWSGAGLNGPLETFASGAGAGKRRARRHRGAPRLPAAPGGKEPHGL